MTTDYFKTKSDVLIKTFESSPSKSIEDKLKEIAEMNNERIEYLKEKHKLK